MSTVYVVGRITIRDPSQWAEYRSRVPATLEPWGGEIVLRASQIAALAGEEPYSDMVVIRFSEMAAVNGWYASPAYQALLPLRDAAAEVVLTVYG